MTKPIKSVAVLGSGVMGSGIAAHIANAGLPVLLLDIVPKGAPVGVPEARNAVAAGAVKKLLKHKPAPLMSTRLASSITVGNLEDDLERAGQCDLIIEAVIERLDIKRSLFERLETCAGEETIIASNTSGLRIADMLEGRSDAFKRRFCVMHFFNPARYMKLLEVVWAAETSRPVKGQVESFGREVLGKGIVVAKDSPNFIANRIGAHSMMATIHLMLDRQLAPEDVDAITGVPMGHPKSATFRTGDVVGIDTLVHVVNNCYEVLTDDEDREVFKVPGYIHALIDQGLLGQKARAGFYKKTREGIETFDPRMGEYRPRGGDAAIAKTCKELAKIPDVHERVRKLVAQEGQVGEFAWQCLSRSLAYAARRMGEISDDIRAVDAALRWGYNWELGPFETWDALGFAETTDRMIAEGIDLPPSIVKMRESGAAGFYKDGAVYDLKSGDYAPYEVDPREITLEVMRRGEKEVLANAGAEAWDLGDGVLGVTYKSKANSVDPDVINLLTAATDRAERDFRALLIFNRGDHFSVGANLFLVAMAAQQKNWDQLREMVKKLQGASQKMKYASVPVVAAPFGMAVGGGLEVCLGADAVQAAAETYAGLVEVGVGLIPAGGGCLNTLWRAFEGIPDGVDYDAYAFVTQVFKNIATAHVATSAIEAMDAGFFRHGDGVSFDRARHLYEAKARAIAMAESGYHAPPPRRYRLPGDSGIATLKMLINTMVAGGHATEHDGLIATRLAAVLCGGVGGAAREVTEDDILDLECEAFLSLCGEQKTIDRIQHMLMKNKPLRN